MGRKGDRTHSPIAAAQRASIATSRQQNLPQFDRAIVVLPAPSNHLADLKPLVAEGLAIEASI